ncbi:formate dehydrogenase accessory protein FdhE [Massilia sp. Root351]|uniref:formate dehydrogenase accessory protein FdhE n=1 Tax=Massilia sp. Root351 TaxID=1736522 RepID=UPI000710A6C5|nr:formate dehydrogenase accessory protein FdhE [Massilia sp. Root351]KQV87257.1 formate dehydrogenase accessory protein FdhE [Massilia sp. Root351]
MVQRLLSPGEIESLDHTTIPRLVLPQPGVLFSARATRLRQLADGNVPGIPAPDSLHGYLYLMAAVADAQAAIAAAGSPAAASRPAASAPRPPAPPVPPLPPSDAMETALAHNMPPLPVSGPRPAGWGAIYLALLDQLDAAASGQPQLAAVLAGLRALSDTDLEGCADAVLAEFGEGINPLHAPFVAAALQLLWVTHASQLDASRVQPPVTGTLCPVCGSHPLASVIRIGGQAQGYRYLHCAICASEWHMVRVKCSCCEKNARIAYQSLAPAGADTGADEDSGGDPAAAPVNKAQDPSRVARAETCDDCRSYRKIFNQEHDFMVEPLADDLASLALDVLVTEAGYARGSVNPLLWFGSE